jgi:2-polyprenyl-3-methyl-5-hydroxy-6-metoxy-1,4-benzoquinol methylase
MRSEWVHGKLKDQPDERQSGNRSWWNKIPMTYEFSGRAAAEPLSLAWFDEIDRRFLEAARSFDGSENPFFSLMNADALAGKRVLEIGCGFGFHSELMLRAGAHLTSIDLTRSAVDGTTARLALKGLRGDVREMDAEHLDFADGEFDMIWSWGVIHHSSRTGVILKEIHRVLKPGGKARIMVYNLEGAIAYMTMLRRYMLGFWRGASLDELLWRDMDGYTARYYTRDLWKDMLDIFFVDNQVHVYGQPVDAVPLPGPLRRPVLKLMGESRIIERATQRGSFLFSVSTKP